MAAAITEKPGSLPALQVRSVNCIPVEVPLGSEDGMPRQCVVNLDSRVTIARSRLERPIARLGPDKMKAIEAAIRVALDLSAAS